VLLQVVGRFASLGHNRLSEKLDLTEREPGLRRVNWKREGEERLGKEE